MFSGAIPQDTDTTSELTFADLGLDSQILERLEALHFQRPTPIQGRALPVALEGSDLIGLAETGSGKTAAFCLPMIERLAAGDGVRGLVLCPTREIALQNHGFLEHFERDRGLASACLIGGVRYKPQIDALRRGPDIVVATPGRLIDHVERGNLDLQGVEILVLDEADHMLDLGFLPQVQRILEMVPSERQTMMFSATMPPPIERLASHFMKEPVRVDLRPEARIASGIDHRLYLVDLDDKKACLLSLVEQEEGAMLVFVRRKIDAEWICRQLEEAGQPVERIHSDRSQKQRVAALSGLRQGEHRILVATDIAARGIDIPRIEHIVNFDIPETVEDYVHRAGRTARGSSGGTVSTIATWLEKSQVAAIERAIDEEIPRCTVPGVEPYVERKKTIRGRERVRRRLR